MLIVCLTEADINVYLINISFAKNTIFSKNNNLPLWITDFKQNIYSQLFKFVLDCIKTIPNII